MEGLTTAVDPLVPQLRLVFGTVLPVVTVVGALLFAIRPNVSSSFGTLIHDEDIEEERERDKKQAVAESSAVDEPSEATPLLERPTQLSGRGIKNTALILLSSLSLVLQAISLFNAVVHGRHVISGAISLAIWVYGALEPLLRPTRRPPYSLFALYVFALATAGLDLYLLRASSQKVIALTWYLIHVAACLTGVLICLSMPMQPNADPDQVQRVDTSLAMDEYATLGQWLTVSWMEPLFVRARTGALHETDIFKISTDCRARLLARKFQSFMPQSKLLRRVALANGRTIAMILVANAMSGALLSLQPVLIQRILAAFPETSSGSVQAGDISLVAFVLAPNEVIRKDTRTAYLFAAIAFTFLVIRSHLAVVTKMVECRFEMHARASVIGAVYRKALIRIDTAGVVDSATSSKDGAVQGNKADLGKVISLVGTDVGQVASLPGIINVLTGTPINLAILCWFLYNTLGISAFVGYVVFLVVGPYTSWCMSRFMGLFRAMSHKRDIRTRAISELLQSIKFIKLSGWETQWAARINVHRDAELAQRFTMLMADALFGLTWRIVPIIITSITLTWFTVVQHRQLTIEIAFPVIIALNQLTTELNNAPSEFGRYASLAAAYGRLDEFLEEEEVDERTSALKQERRDLQYETDQRVGAQEATFQWHKHTSRTPGATGRTLSRRDRFRRLFRMLPPTPDAGAAAAVIEDAPFQLHNISFLCPHGKLSVITGPTGSGKSSLLAALLGEMHLVSGTVFLPKDTHVVDVETGLTAGTSFCSQHPWLESKTIRENILFGSPYEEERYETVLEACSLSADLAILDNGDETEIGDRGVVLSGGQKARVALARAVYSRTQNVLLDDVISAVDIHTARTLISKCLFGPIMNGRTVVLVTHHLASVAHGAAWIVKMDNGSIKTQGTPDNLRRNGELDLNFTFGADGADTLHDAVGDAAKEGMKEKQVDGKQPFKLVDAETTTTGAVRREIYFKYIKAASYWILAILGFTIVVRETGLLGQRFWIKHWTESYGQPQGWRDMFWFPSATDRVMPYVLVYLAMQLAVVLLMLGVYVPSLMSTLRASRTLFREMLESILRSPTRYFDKTPAGRIINRFSKDIGWVDGSVATYMQLTAGMMVSFFVSATTVTLSVPPFVLVLVPLMWLHLWVARGYITAGRDLTRLRSTTYSPVINLFSEVLHGLTTIRAFRAESRFCEAVYHLLDRYHWTDYCHSATDAWLSYRFNVLGSFTFLASSWLGIYIGISPGLLAIVITQAQNIMVQLAFGLNMYVGMENGMNSVERVQEYIDLPAEPPRRVPGVPAAWPFLDQGITFKDVVLRYAPGLDPVLRGISFHVKAGEKIGIVGRTGSGKSTLAMSLFRFVDPDEGTISIGGMDITKVGVQDLREHLTLIPQDAALYGGTIRENLDPFNEHTDAECIDALRMVQLPIETSSGSASPRAEEAATTEEPGSVTQTIITLESKVSDGGANWSAGQRQLIAMARALLRNSGIVVLDESTASVDFETDKKIQMTIRERFIGSILLTIAHRLHTIIDYDRVLVLDHGKVVEFDTPAVLIANTGGVFRGMCEQSGHFAELKAAAEGNLLIVI